VKPAVFLDRDGVINELIYNPSSGEHEPPHDPADFRFLPNALDALEMLGKNDFLLFIISNQPDYAKGKTTLENIRAVHETMHGQLAERCIVFTEYYYCYHHPNGTVPEYTKQCTCRKPGTFFIEEAVRTHHVDIARSWLIGDRDSDILAGEKAGIKTILVEYEVSKQYRGTSSPSHNAKNLSEAAKIIVDSISR